MVTDDVAYAEVFEILSYMNKKTVMKIPLEVLQYIKENRNITYISKINPNNIFNPKNISKEAKNILACIDLEYLASDESRKEKLKIYKENERKYQEELSKKYKFNDMFDSKDKEVQNEFVDHISLVEYKEKNWYQKIFARILKIFRKN